MRDDYDDQADDLELDLEERHALRRVAGLSTELEDVTEVEYRQVRLERVVLAGVWTEGTVRDAERSLAELALLAETAGSMVLEGATLPSGVGGGPALGCLSGVVGRARVPAPPTTRAVTHIVTLGR